MVITYVGVGANLISGGLWVLALIIAFLVGGVLAIVSLAVGERRTPAVVTLSLIGATLALLVIGFLVFFGLYQG